MGMAKMGFTAVFPQPPRKSRPSTGTEGIGYGSPCLNRTPIQRGIGLGIGLGAAVFLAFVAAQRSRMDSASALLSTASSAAPLAETGPVSPENPPGRRLILDEVDRQLAAILAAIQNPEARALQVIRVIESADLADPKVGERVWNFAIRSLGLEIAVVEAMESLGRHWVIADRTSAWSFLTDPTRVPAGFEGSLGPIQYEALKGALQEWMNWDRGEALHLARTVPLVLHKQGLFIQLYRRWAETDPETAWDEIQKEEFALELGGFGAGLTLLPVIQSKDPSLALRLARSVPAEFWNSPDAQRGVAGIQRWVQEYPAHAAPFVQEIPGDAGQMLAKSLALHWARTDPTAALDWVLRREATGVPSHPTPYLLGEVALWDPQAAVARWSVASPERQVLWAPPLATSWAQSDPAAASAWAQTLAPGVEQDSALRSVYLEWAGGDPEAAIDSLPRLETSQRDQARVGIVQTLMNQNLAWAADQSLRVSDPLIQSQLLESTFQRWMSSAPDAATAWLDRSGLPEPLSTRLRALRR